MADQRLTWGGLTLAEPTSNPTADGWLIEAMGDGTNFDNPQALVEIVQSLLTDGTLAAVQRWDNREAPIRLRLSAPAAGFLDVGPALAEAEAALMAEVLREPRPSSLRWEPPVTNAEPTIFDVVSATLERDTEDGWDFEEKQRAYRYYLLTLTCLPFARAEFERVSPIETTNPGSETQTVLSDGTSDVPWSWGASTPSDSESLLVSAGRVRFSGDNGGFERPWDLEFSGIIDVADGEYIRVDIERNAADLDDLFRTLLTFGNANPVASFAVGLTPEYVEELPAGYPEYAHARLWFRVLGGHSDTSLNLRITSPGLRFGYVWVDNLLVTDTRPVITPRQHRRGVHVYGSAPTQASLTVMAEGNAASDIMVHTGPHVFDCNLRANALHSSAATTVDSSAVSGATNSLSSPMVFRIPARRIPPGNYAIVARLQDAGAATIGWETVMLPNDDSPISGSVTLPVTGSMNVLFLESVTLPPLAHADDSVNLEVQLTLSLESGTSPTIDEVWLFDLTSGALTWVHVDIPGGIDRISARSPEGDRPRPDVFGDNGQSVAQHCKSFGVHEFRPGPLQVFWAVTGDASDPTTSQVIYHPRYHSHALRTPLV